MKASTKCAILLISIYLLIGYSNNANSQSLQFSNCNDIITETKLTEILGHNTMYGTNDTETGTFKKCNQPTELDKTLKTNTAAKFGCASCNFSGPPRGGNGIFASTPIYTGIIEICTTNTQNRFASFSSKNAANLTRFNQTVIEESAEIGKATVVNKIEMGHISKSLSLKFLDDEVDVFVDVTIHETNMRAGRSKVSKTQKPMENKLQKIKKIAKEVEANVK